MDFWHSARACCSQIFVSTYYTLLDSYRPGKQDLSNFQNNVHQLDIHRMRIQCCGLTELTLSLPTSTCQAGLSPRDNWMGMGSLPRCGGVWLSMLPFPCSLATMRPLRVCGLASPRSLLEPHSGERPDMGAEAGLPLPCHCHHSVGFLNHQLLSIPGTQSDNQLVQFCFVGRSCYFFFFTLQEQEAYVMETTEKHKQNNKTNS